MGSPGARKVRSGRLASAAVVILLGLCGPLAACEYIDDGGRLTPSPAARSFTDPVLPRDPELGRTVSGDKLDAWAQAVVPDSQGQSFYASRGLVRAGESRTEQTVQLPGGSYAVSLACRGTRRASFVVKNGDAALVELTLDCANTRVNVLQLAKDAVLAITVSANNDANFAYRVSRL